jgi:hypothetical protein
LKKIGHTTRGKWKKSKKVILKFEKAIPLEGNGKKLKYATQI